MFDRALRRARGANPAREEALHAVQDKVSGAPFDPIVVLDNIEHDQELFEEMIGIFLDSVPAMWAELDAAVAAQEPPRVAAVAHSLKGALLTLAAQPSSDLALDLEQQGRSGDLSRSTGVLAQLRLELDRLITVLQSTLKQS